MHSLWPQDPQVVLKTSSWKTVGDLFCELQGKALAQPSQAIWLWGTYLSFWSPNVKQGLMILLPVRPGFPMLCLQGLCLCSSGHVVVQNFPCCCYSVYPSQCHKIPDECYRYLIYSEFFPLLTFIVLYSKEL